jgi:hypothetical protein
LELGAAPAIPTCKEGLGAKGVMKIVRENALSVISKLLDISVLT